MLFIILSPVASPEAQVELNVTGQESIGLSRSFLTDQGFDLTGYESAVAFGTKDDALVYIQRTHTPVEGNELTREYNVWYWSVRWFKPDEPTEYYVAIDTAAPQVIGFDRVNYPETEPGARLSEDEARRTAESLLTRHGYDLANWTLVASQSQSQPERTDYTFSWQHRTVQVKEAYPKVDVVVEGDQATSLSAYLLVPDAFQREYEKTTSIGTLLANITGGLMLLLWIIALVMAIRLARQAAWGMGLWGATLLAVVSLASAINALPVARYTLPTTFTPTVFYIFTIVVGVLGGVFSGAGILFPAAAGQAMLVEMDRDGAPFFGQVRKRLLSPGFAGSAVRGLSLAGIWLGFMSLFYFVGREYLGVWSPAGPRYSDILATPAPWLYPLTISVMAAFSEEYTFRLFGTALLKRWLRWTPLALVIPSAVWAFAHSNYPVFPVWTRGIELTIMGTFLAWVFWKYDIETTIIAHYTYDALLVGWPLLLSGNSYYVASGAVVTGLALVPALLGWIAARRSPAPAAPLEPAPPTPAEPAPPETVTPVLPVDPVPAEASPTAVPVRDIGGAMLDRFLTAVRQNPVPWFLAGLAALLIAILAALSPESSLVQEYAVSEPQAESIAREYLAQQGYDVTGLRVARDMGSESFMTYVEDVAPDEADAILREYAGVRWHVRFYQPLDPVTYMVSIDIRTGQVVAFSRQLPPDAWGAAPELAEARQTAERFLTDRGVDLTALTPVDSSTLSHDNRTDSWFVWENQDSRLPDSRIRQEVLIQGDQVGQYLSPYVYVPEAWEREQEKRDMWGIMGAIGVVLGGLVWIVFAIIYLVKQQASWRTAGLLALVTTVLSAIGALTAWPSMAMGYDTSMIWGAFAAVMLIGVIFGPLFMGAGMAALWSVGSVVARNRPQPMALGRAALSGLAVAGFSAGISTLLSLAGESLLPAMPEVVDIAGGYWSIATLLTIPLIAMAFEFIFRFWFQSLASRYLRSRLFGLIAQALLLTAIVFADPQPGVLYEAVVTFVGTGLVFGLAYLVGGLPVVIIGQSVLMILGEGLTRMGATLPSVALHGYAALALGLFGPLLIWLWSSRRQPAA